MRDTIDETLEVIPDAVQAVEDMPELNTDYFNRGMVRDEFLMRYSQALDGVELPSIQAFDRWQAPVYDMDINKALNVHFDRRSAFIYFYSFAIPTEEAITKLVDLEPLIEIGAGTGYWSALIASRGGDVISTELATDNQLNGWSQRIARHCSINTLGNATMAYIRNRTPFICWPPNDTDLAVTVALRVQLGGKLAYVGEPRDGCTATKDFFDLMDDRFKIIDGAVLPTWRRLDDSLFIFERVK